MSLFLEELEQTAIQRIKKFAKIADAYKFNIAVGFSGGKDSQVVYAILSKIRKRISISQRGLFENQKTINYDTGTKRFTT